MVAVSHDRAFLRQLDRFLMVLHDGSVLSLPTFEAALEALKGPATAPTVRLAKLISEHGLSGAGPTSGTDAHESSLSYDVLP